MSTTLPYNVSDQTLTFFARSRPYEVQRGHKHFDHIKGILTSWRQEPRSEVDIDSLIALADPKEALTQATGGLIEFRGNEIVFGGLPIHNLWVDKILGFRDADMPYEPIFNALQDLQRNPTPAARDRLPIFVERSKLGFLPDGRIAAFKGVRENFNDVHSNSVNYGVGKTVSIPREACNADPSQTCVAGLHVGAIDYIKEMGYGWGPDRRMLLCAFWPRHAVAVPTDYRGGKMRVEQLEVLDEVDRKYVDELLNNGQLIVRGYDASPHAYSAPLTPAASSESGVEDEAEDDEVEESGPIVTGPAANAKVGDWIEVENDSVLEDGQYLVAKVNDPSEEFRLDVKVGSADDEVDQPDNDAVTQILSEAPAWFRAKVGDWISLYNETIPQRVVKIDEGEILPDEMRLQTAVDGGTDWVLNSDVESLLAEPPVVALRVEDDDQVRIEGHTFLKDGVYKVYDTDTYTGIGDDDQRVQIETTSGDTFWINNSVIKSIIREEEAAAAATPMLALPAPEAPVDIRPFHEQAEVGDIVTVKGSQDTKDGDYEVTAIATNPAHRVQVDATRNLHGTRSWYIRNEAIVGVRKKGAPAPAPVDTRPVWEQAKLGDTIRVQGDHRHLDGEYVVDKVDAADYMGRRLRVTGSHYLWVNNDSVKAITKVA